VDIQKTERILHPWLVGSYNNKHNFKVCSLQPYTTRIISPT